MGRRYRKLWDLVKRIIKDNYDVLIKRSIRGSYYIVGDYLAPHIGNEITLEDYNYFGIDKAYNVFRDDVWTWIEQKWGLQRPEAAPVGVVWDNGIEHPIRKLETVWQQARGFIFVEKADEAEDLQELSRFGWTICAGRGYPTRLVRKLLKEDTRPVLVLHDWDRDGIGIYAALGFETRRTSHLDIALGERVADLGLTEKDVRKLNLPTRPSPPKYKGRPRVELSALELLATRMDIENPVLAYSIASMLAKGLMLSPAELTKEELLGQHLRWLLTKGLKGVVSEVVTEFLEEVKGEEAVEGEAVEGILEDAKIISGEIRKALWQTAHNLTENLSWKSEDDFHQEALQKFANQELIDLLAE